VRPVVGPPHYATVPDLDLLTLEVTCDVGYLCDNFSLPRPLCSRLRPGVRDRLQTDVRRQTRIIAYARRGGA